MVFGPRLRADSEVRETWQGHLAQITVRHRPTGTTASAVGLRTEVKKTTDAAFARLLNKMERKNR